MSAYVVSDKHINSILSWWKNRARARRLSPWRGPGGLVIDPAQAGDLQRAAEMLKAENIRSVNFLYPDTIMAPDNTPGKVGEAQSSNIQFILGRGEFSGLEILKALDCYDYQACESDDYDETPSAALVRHLRGVAIRALAGYSEAAGWELGDK